MKLAVALLAVLAITGLSQAHKVPDFGKGPLHDDIQDILDLIPMEEIAEVFLDYLAEDAEVKAAARYLQNSSLLKDLVVEVEAVPEVINFLNYLQRGGVNIYDIVNAINRVFDIKRLVPPPIMYSATMKRTGGIAGFFKDVKSLFHYDDFIKIYVRKMRTSTAFVDFVKQLKSDNFQQIVNKVYVGKSFQIILNGLKTSGVKLQIIADIMYIVLGITVPKDASRTPSLTDELMDFVKLIPGEEVGKIVIEYVTKDAKVQKALQYPLTSEFHSLLRNVEALKEHQKLVIYIEKAGIKIIDSIKYLHRAIGMEDYVPPKIETVLESEIGVQKVGDGLQSMLDDITKILPLDKINALYKEKLKTSKVFADFVEKMTSSEYQGIVKALTSHKTFQEMIAKSKEAGLDLLALEKFSRKLLPIPAPEFIFTVY